MNHLLGKLYLFDFSDVFNCFLCMKRISKGKHCLHFLCFVDTYSVFWLFTWTLRGKRTNKVGFAWPEHSDFPFGKRLWHGACVPNLLKTSQLQQEKTLGTCSVETVQLLSRLSFSPNRIQMLSTTDSLLQINCWRDCKCSRAWQMLRGCHCPEHLLSRTLAWDIKTLRVSILLSPLWCYLPGFGHAHMHKIITPANCNLIETCIVLSAIDTLDSCDYFEHCPQALPSDCSNQIITESSESIWHLDGRWLRFRILNLFFAVIEGVMGMGVTPLALPLPKQEGWHCKGLSYFSEVGKLMLGAFISGVRFSFLDKREKKCPTHPGHQNSLVH